MAPILPNTLYPVFRGLLTDEDGSVTATREYLHGVLEISPLGDVLPHDELLAEELSLFSSN